MLRSNVQIYSFASGLQEKGPKLTKMRDIGKHCRKCETKPKIGKKEGFTHFLQDIGNSCATTHTHTHLSNCLEQDDHSQVKGHSWISLVLKLLTQTVAMVEH